MDDRENKDPGDLILDMKSKTETNESSADTFPRNSYTIPFEGS
jgi:hypothetical protein